MVDYCYLESDVGVDLYPHSGGMVDYCYLGSGVGQAKEPLAHTFELRGNSFIVPAGDIILSGVTSLPPPRATVLILFFLSVVAAAAVRELRWHCQGAGKDPGIPELNSVSER
jgi:hypothetical protein